MKAFKLSLIAVLSMHLSLAGSNPGQEVSSLCISLDENVEFQGPLVEGKKQGEWKGIDKEGNLAFVEVYEDDQLVYGRRYIDGQVNYYSRFFVPPHSNQINKLAQHIDFSVDSRKKGVDGKISVNVVVSEHGEILEVEVIKGLDPVCDKQVIKAIKEHTQWQPAYYRGKPVVSCHMVNVRFELI